MQDPCSSLKRPAFFSGQLLTAADLEAEQRYFIERFRRQNRWLHGTGIVAGLEVSFGHGELQVAPGFAIDCWGNEIEICEPSNWPLPKSRKPCYLTLVAIERETDPVPALSQTSPAAGVPLRYTRVEEAWAFAYSEEDPTRAHRKTKPRHHGCEAPHGVALARLLYSRGRWRLDPRHRRSKGRRP